MPRPILGGRSPAGKTGVGRGTGIARECMVLLRYTSSGGVWGAEGGKGEPPSCWVKLASRSSESWCDGVRRTRARA